MDCLAERIPFDDVGSLGNRRGNSRSVDGIGIAFTKGRHGEDLIHGVFRIHALLLVRILLGPVTRCWRVHVYWEAKYRTKSPPKSSTQIQQLIRTWLHFNPNAQKCYWRVNRTI